MKTPKINLYNILIMFLIIILLYIVYSYHNNVIKHYLKNDLKEKFYGILDPNTNCGTAGCMSGCLCYNGQYGTTVNPAGTSVKSDTDGDFCCIYDGKYYNGTCQFCGTGSNGVGGSSGK